jgi:rhamnosyltransferase
MSVPPANRRCLVYHCRAFHGRLPGHVGFALKGLAPFYETTVLICDMELPSEDIDAVGCEGLQTVFSGERNPYVAWASFVLGWDPEWAEGFDSMTFTHSDAFGPLSDMQDFFREMESRNIDYWGVTNRSLGSLWGMHSRSFGRFRSRLAAIKPVECFFITFRKRVFTDKSFRRVWDGLPGNTTHYYAEWLIARHLKTAGFKGGVLLDVDSLDKAEWFMERMDVMLDGSAPFIHAMNIRHQGDSDHIWKRLSRMAGFSTVSLSRYLSARWMPHEALRYIKKIWTPSRLPNATEPGMPTVAVHIHVFHLDVFERLMEELYRTEVRMDVFVTTPLPEARDGISAVAAPFSDRLPLASVIEMENRGRDVLPWLTIAPSLAAYDIVGHFHTKKSGHLLKHQSERWMDHLVETLVVPFKRIALNMQADPGIGIVIPDMPFFGNWVDVEYWRKNEKAIRTLLSELGLQESVRLPEGDKDMVFSHGNMFWYRPAALDALTSHDWRPEDFQGEPVPTDGTLMHAIERLPIYAAWAKGYDFRIMLNPATQMSVWELNLLKRLDN